MATKCTLLPNFNGGDEPAVVFNSIKDALAWLGDEIDELNRYGGVYCLASDPTQTNVFAWWWHGNVVDADGYAPDYPDEVWSVYWSERNQEWLIKRERV